ncbi:MAG TPA: hypothetical protein VFC77_07985, partial [Myxococcota bacterium]|nr:hypothetical protein [Myxococcota bacterium]
MRCAELLAALVLPAGGTEPPPLHESGLESGLRIVVATSSASSDGSDVSTGTSNAPIEAVLVVPVGFANDAARSGSGLAALAADFATQAPEGQAQAQGTWRAELLPTRTLYCGRFAADALEAALATLATRLSPDGVEEERFNELVKTRSTPPPTTVDRFRETAWPTSRFGARPRAIPSGPSGSGGAAALSRDALKQFLEQRVGSEGTVLVLVGAAPPASLELLAGRALGKVPRARGVAPAEELEPFPSKARRVAAPDGATQALVGFRLPWREDERGDEVALAAAFLESKARRPCSCLEATPQGACIAFADEGPAAGAALRETLAGAAARLARGGALEGGEIDAALDRLDAALAESASTPAGLARLLAESAAAWDDPRVAFGR